MDENWISMGSEGFIGLVGPLEYQRCTGGSGRFRFRAEDKHRNRNEVVHGGMIMTFADRALGTTARQEDWSRRQATVQLDVHFVAPARIGTLIEAECRIVRATSSLTFVEGTITSEGMTVAKAQGIWKIIMRDPASEMLAKK